MLELAQHWHDGKAEQRVYALVTDERDEPSVHVLPDVPAARAQLSSPAKPLYFWRIKVNASEIAEIHPFVDCLHHSRSGSGFERLHQQG